MTTPTTREELIEVMAGELIVLLTPRDDENDFDRSEALENCKGYARIILRHIEDTGIALVPKVATQAMLDEVSSADGYEPFSDKTMGSIYTAMLSASPFSPISSALTHPTKTPEQHGGGE